MKKLRFYIYVLYIILFVLAFSCAGNEIKNKQSNKNNNDQPFKVNETVPDTLSYLIIDYTSDGTIKSRGETILHKNIPTYLKLNLEKVLLKDVVVASNNGIIKNANKDGKFDFIVTPQREGIIKFTLFIKKEGNMLKLGTATLKVIE